jgi:hypothetical protein
MAEPVESKSAPPAPDEMPTPEGAPSVIDQSATASVALSAIDEAAMANASLPIIDESATAVIVPLVWVAHPLLRRRVLGALVGLGIMVASLVLGFWTRSLFWGVFSAGVLFLSLETFFLPSRYEAGALELGVQKAFSKVRTPWASFRRVYEDRHGLTLSPYRRRTFIEPYRSTRLLFDGGEATAIKDVVRARCPQAAWLGPGKRGGKETER